jgi:hypothetical protein
MHRTRLLPLLAFSLLLLFGSLELNAQDASRYMRRQDRREGREARQDHREAHGQIKKRAVKEARKETRKLTRQGWATAPAALPMAKQLERAWTMQYQTDDRMNLVFINADGNGVANTQTAAQIQAFEMAKLNLAGQIQTEIRALVEANIANQQLTQQEAATVNRILTTSRNIIATRLNRIEPAFVIYRQLRGGNVECQVMLLYNRQQAIQQAGDVIRQQLDQDLRRLSERWDQIIGLDVPPASAPRVNNGAAQGQ